MLREWIQIHFYHIFERNNSVLEKCKPLLLGDFMIRTLSTASRNLYHPLLNTFWARFIYFPQLLYSTQILFQTTWVWVESSEPTWADKGAVAKNIRRNYLFYGCTRNTRIAGIPRCWCTTAKDQSCRYQNGYKYMSYTIT